MGPYPSRLTSYVYTNHMQKKYGYNWPEPENQTRYERFLDKLEDFIQTLYTPINYFLDKREQKVSVKIDRWDTWSMDHTLAYIVVPMLKQLRDTKHGAPVVDNRDVPKELRQPDSWLEQYEKAGETDENWFKRWDWVLGEMIWAFEQKCRDDWESDYYKYEKGAGDGFLGGYKLVWEDFEGRKAHQERMSNGFRLFGKYYESLWD